MVQTRVSVEMRQRARSLRQFAKKSQAVKGKIVHVISNPTRPLRGHPPLKGEGESQP